MYNVPLYMGEKEFFFVAVLDHAHSPVEPLMRVYKDGL
jgi:hypothetical protein